MNVPAAARCCVPSRATAVSSAPMAQCLVRPSRRARHRHAARFKQQRAAHGGGDKARHSPPGLVCGHQAEGARCNPPARSLAVRSRREMESTSRASTRPRVENGYQAFCAIGQASASAPNCHRNRPLRRKYSSACFRVTDIRPDGQRCVGRRHPLCLPIHRGTDRTPRTAPRALASRRLCN
jgi:hypothetical protein